MNTTTSRALIALLMITPSHAGFVTEISISREVQYQQSSVTTVSRISANSLEAGHVYFLGSSFGAIVGQSSAMPKCLSIASFGTETTIKIVAE